MENMRSVPIKMIDKLGKHSNYIKCKYYKFSNDMAHVKNDTVFFQEILSECSEEHGTLCPSKTKWGSFWGVFMLKLSLGNQQKYEPRSIFSVILIILRIKMFIIPNKIMKMPSGRKGVFWNISFLFDAYKLCNFEELKSQQSCYECCHIWYIQCAVTFDRNIT